MYAVVVFVITGTEAAAPTAAVPEPETLPATRSRSSFSLAAMRTFPSAVRTAPSPELSPCSTNACVVMLSTETAALTFTAAVPPKPPPTAIDVIDSLDSASTVMSPRTLAVTSGPIHAFVPLVIASTSTPAPTLAVPPTLTVPAIAEDLGRVARGDLDALRRGRAGVVAVDRRAAIDVGVGVVLEDVDDRRAGDACVAAARAACGEQEQVRPTGSP